MVRSFHSSIRRRQFSFAAADEGDRVESVGSVDARRCMGGIMGMYSPGVGVSGVVICPISCDCERPGAL